MWNFKNIKFAFLVLEISKCDITYFVIRIYPATFLHY